MSSVPVIRTAGAESGPATHPSGSSAGPERVLAVNRCVFRALAVFLVLVVLGWLPQVSALHLSATRSPLFQKEKRMGDLFNAGYQMKHFSALTIGPTFNYPAPAAFVLAFFLRSSHPKIYFILAVGIAVGTAALLLWLALRRSAIRPWLAAAVIVSFAALGTPQIFVLDRANLEWVSWILLALAMTCFFIRRYLPMALLLGLAICMKPFPVLFFLLLLYRRRYKEIALGVSLAAVLTLIALKALGPSVSQAYASLQIGLNAYKLHYIESIRLPDEMRFDHALMSPVHVVLFRLFGNPDIGDHLDMTSRSLPLLARMDLWRDFFAVVGISGVLSVAWLGRKLPTLNQILLLALSTTLLPFISAEYTLLVLYIPFAFMLIWLGRDVAAGQAPMPPFALLCLFALLLAPLGLEFNLYVGLAQCALLIALVIYTLRTPMPMRWLDETVPGKAAAATT